jgi:hypothetical protein
VYVKPIKREASQSNLLISTRSGQHVSLELINDGTEGGSTPVDFLLDYKPAGSFLVRDTAPTSAADGNKEAGRCTPCWSTRECTRRSAAIGTRTRVRAATARQHA